MSQLTVQQAINFALHEQREGRLQDAEAVYRQVLATVPEQADAHHLLGVIAYQTGRFAEAESHIRRAIAATPGEASFRLTLGLVLQSTRRFGEAVQNYQELLAAHPQLADGHGHLGIALSNMGRHEEAVAAYESALRLAPEQAVALANLGISLCHLFRFEEAAPLLRKAVALAPENADYHSALGTALSRLGQPDEAAAECREAIRLAPQKVEASFTLATILHGRGDYDGALGPARRAMEMLSHVPDVQTLYADTLRKMGRVDEAVAVYREALQRFPQAADLYNNLAHTLREQGELEEAVRLFERSLELKPDAPAVYSNLLYALQYQPAVDPNVLFARHREFDGRFAAPLTAAAPGHANDPSPGRRLRVGYLSSEFRAHALGYYLVPLFDHHNRTEVEVVCYSDVRSEDAITQHLRSRADAWTSVRNLSNQQVADRIRADRIDILIDLHQHMGENRLLVFARKPAPVQIGFAGYPGTTGLTAIDYRLTDQYLEPPTVAAVASTEMPIRLPETFWCYFPRGASVPVTPLPALERGYVTFGNLNNPAKLNEPLLALWAQTMRVLPTSRLALLAPGESMRQRIVGVMARHGVAAERLLFHGWQQGLDYFRVYQGIDIGLDSFPYNGHTTSLDSFYMGVPVVTLSGQSPVSRGGFSQLMNLGLPELASTSRDGFVHVATQLAQDLPRLASLRVSLRDRMQASPLMNGARFARNVEAAYRTAWQAWCRQQ